MKEIPTMVIDEEDECVDKKTQEKTNNCSVIKLQKKIQKKI